MRKTHLLLGFSAVLVAASYIPLLACTENTFNRLTSEDNVYENATAIFYFLGGAFLIYIWYILMFKGKQVEKKRRSSYFILLLGLFLFFCCMEEISWGQRLFGIKTPQVLVSNNEQGEINIHNLFLFSNVDETGHIKAGISRWFTSARLYALFWFVYCVAVPFSDRFFARLKDFYLRIGLPVVPLWIGMLFLLNHIVAKIVEHLMPPNDIQNITEIKETNFAFLFLLVSLSFLVTRIEKQFPSSEISNL